MDVEDGPGPGGGYGLGYLKSETNLEYSLEHGIFSEYIPYVMGVRYSRIENWAIVARRQSTRLFLLNKPEKECLARRHAEGVEGPRTALSFLGVRAIRSASH